MSAGCGTKRAGCARPPRRLVCAVALAALVCFLVVTVGSAILLADHHHHHCAGQRCAVCAQLHRLSRLAGLVPAACAAAALWRVFSAEAFVLPRCQPPPATPVTDRVKLNN